MSNLLEDLNTFRTMLRVNKHRLDDELEIQSDVMDRIGRVLARITARATELKDNRDRIKARIILEHKDSGDRVTDKEAESRVMRDREYLAAAQAYQVELEQADEWQKLYEAWKARGFDVGRLCDLYIAQYFTQETHHIRARDRDAINNNRVADIPRDRTPVEAAVQQRQKRRARIE